MPMRRRPPKGNVRRVVYVERNSRGVMTNKAGRLVQFESFKEHTLLLQFDRDRSIIDYGSQPETFVFTDQEGKQRRYTPDFIVWRRGGKTEIHEVTLVERRGQSRIRARERAAQLICQKRGWQYIVHTEQNLPQETETANLLALLRYRPKVYARESVANHAKLHLQQHGSLSLGELAAKLASDLTMPQQIIYAALCHFLWHGILDSDFHTLFAFEGTILPDIKLWLSKDVNKERC